MRSFLLGCGECIFIRTISGPGGGSGALCLGSACRGGRLCRARRRCRGRGRLPVLRLYLRRRRGLRDLVGLGLLWAGLSLLTCAVFLGVSQRGFAQVSVDDYVV